MAHSYDVIVIGAGPAGYSAAIRCAQLGLHTLCLDRWRSGEQPALGGTCLNAGCIPSKALLESSQLYQTLQQQAAQHGILHDTLRLDLKQMMQRKEQIVSHLSRGISQLFRANKIDHLHGDATLHAEHHVHFMDANGHETTFQAEQVILAPGSVPTELENAKWLEQRIVNSAGALSWEQVPPRLGIIGAGAIGLELGSVWQRLGAKVTLLEAQDQFLTTTDRQIAQQAQRALQKQGLEIRLNARLLSCQAEPNDGIKLHYEDGEGKHVLTVDRVITAVGRQPNTDTLFSSEVDLQLDERGFIHVDRYCATSLPGIYAIGDVVRGPMLAHKGSAEGVMVAERIAGQQSELEYQHIPAVIYTQPEIAWVGQNEEQLKTSATPYKSGQFPFAANGRAKVMCESHGTVKILSHADSDRILGVHIIGPHASELIAQAVIAMEMEASCDDLTRMVFAHPSLSEALHEAALALDGRAIHLP
ncbi:MAG: dihydrolipoyl dehydrogenase [Gammaproteobacteria bacterium]|nr:dihydrolipoyl dehydrogenase [Gammaproteobacteria bacterium]